MAATVKGYINSFAERLNAVDPGKLSLQTYPAEYLQLLLDNRIYYLNIYAHVLDLLLQNINKSKEDITLVDYGAGNGLLGMFAKYCGFKKVFLNDVSGIFLNASKQVSEVLKIPVDGFIEGECNAVLEFFMPAEVPDAVIGTDVIEHIYRLYNFFTCVKKMNDKMVTVFTTASVSTNPIKSKQLKKLQYDDEYKGSNANHADSANAFAGMPFLEIRKKIIGRNFVTLTDKQVTELAMATRGMNSDDIIKAGKRFMDTGSLPKPPSHPTNTCDPITGSWTERLLTVKEYETIYSKAGFSLQVYRGFYNQWSGGLKALSLKILNRLTKLNLIGKYITPFITLVGK